MTIETNLASTMNVTVGGDITLSIPSPDEHPGFVNVNTPREVGGAAEPLFYQAAVVSLIFVDTPDLPERLEAAAKVLADHAVAVRLARSVADA